MKQKQKTALKAFFCVEDVFVLLPDLARVYLDTDASWHARGSDVSLVLTLAPIGSLELVPSGSTWSKKSDWSALKMLIQKVHSITFLFFLKRPSLFSSLEMHMLKNQKVF